MKKISIADTFGSFCDEDSFLSRENCENQKYNSSYLENLYILR